MRSSDLEFRTFSVFGTVWGEPRPVVQNAPALQISSTAAVLDEGEKALKSLRTFSPPLSDLIERRPYVEMQSLLDAVWPPGRLYYNKAHNLRTLSEAAAQTVVAYARSMPTTVSNIAFQQLHGAASRASATETAFPHRYDHYDFLAHPATDNPADCERMIQWARECWGAMQPFAEHAVYVNALEDAVEEGETPGAGSVWAQLQAPGGLKDRVRPNEPFSAQREHQAGSRSRLESGVHPVRWTVSDLGFQPHLRLGAHS